MRKCEQAFVMGVIALITSAALVGLSTVGIASAVKPDDKENGRPAGCDGNPHSGPTKDGGNPHHPPVDSGNPHFCPPIGK